MQDGVLWNMKHCLKVVTRDFPGGPGVKDPPCNAWLGKQDPTCQEQSLPAATTEPKHSGAHTAWRILRQETKILCAATKTWHSQITNCKKSGKDILENRCSNFSLQDILNPMLLIYLFATT